MQCRELDKKAADTVVLDRCCRPDGFDICRRIKWGLRADPKTGC